MAVTKSRILTEQDLLSQRKLMKSPVAVVREEYEKLSRDYIKLLNGDYLRCPKCGKIKTSTAFYIDPRFESGKFPVCKDCISRIVEGRIKEMDPPHETKENVQKALRIMDLPYKDPLYEQCKDRCYSETNTQLNNIQSPFIMYLQRLKAFSSWYTESWNDSVFETNSVQAEYDPYEMRKPRSEIIQLFGTGFTKEEYLYLQDQYDDWKSRTQIDSKAQEVYIVRICFKQLDLWKAQRAGEDTKDLDKSLNDLMGAANLQPKQNVNNSANDVLTFGQLIEKWETTKPIPEPEPEFKDVDGIGKYIRVWFKGALSHAIGIKNGYTSEFEDEMTRYTVEKPKRDTEEENSTTIYNTLFGKEEE